ncbi:hypothetical protein [Reichenbachiella sp. MALMAid0571]|uniref:hypothetical protein n=1 Tax=Reichenbachiella sp. MALMAid0571 TaxID=3143939 RepID=UPI0032DE8268
MLEDKSIIKMGLQETKLGVMQKIMGVSKTSFLGKIDKLLEKEMIVSYTLEGKPLTKALYNSHLQKAEEQLSSGKFITQAELEKESDNW